VGNSVAAAETYDHSLQEFGHTNLVSRLHVGNTAERNHFSESTVFHDATGKLQILRTDPGELQIELRSMFQRAIPVPAASFPRDDSVWSGAADA
jgi:hypothetical protein